MNQKRYWLRGGIILTAIVFVMLILGRVVLKMGDTEVEIFGVLLKLPIMVVNVFGLVLAPTIKLIIAGIVWFIVGSILGYLYGKITQKKYWFMLPGAIVGVYFYFALEIFGYSLAFYSESSLAFQIAYPIYLVLMFFPKAFVSQSVAYIIGPIIYACVGAGMGFIYGKIRNRNKNLIK